MLTKVFFSFKGDDHSNKRKLVEYLNDELFGENGAFINDNLGIDVYYYKEINSYLADRKDKSHISASRRSNLFMCLPDEKYLNKEIGRYCIEELTEFAKFKNKGRIFILIYVGDKSKQDFEYFYEKSNINLPDDDTLVEFNFKDQAPGRSWREPKRNRKKPNELVNLICENVTKLLNNCINDRTLVCGNLTIKNDNDFRSRYRSRLEVEFESRYPGYYVSPALLKPTPLIKKESRILKNVYEHCNIKLLSNCKKSIFIYDNRNFKGLKPLDDYLDDINNKASIHIFLFEYSDVIVDYLKERKNNKEIYLYVLDLDKNNFLISLRKNSIIKVLNRYYENYNNSKPSLHDRKFNYIEKYNEHLLNDILNKNTRQVLSYSEIELLQRFTFEDPIRKLMDEEQINVSDVLRLNNLKIIYKGKIETSGEAEAPSKLNNKNQSSEFEDKHDYSDGALNNNDSVLNLISDLLLITNNIGTNE